MSVLLSIKPEFAEKIFSGEKRFEFRRVLPKRTMDRVVVYASSPVCRIIGEFSVEGVISAHPRELWRRTHAHAGISKRYFDAYFEGRREAHAIAVGTMLRYRQPIDPREVDRIFRAPQSFAYLDGLRSIEQRLRSAA